MYFYRVLIKTWKFIILILLSSSSIYALEEKDIIGIWSTPENASRIEIYQCGQKYCGKIVWLKEDKYSEDDSLGMGGKKKIDRNNRNPVFQNRPLVGVELMEGFVYAGKLRWERGLIYNPSNGHKYRCKMKLASRDKLHVRGYFGISLFGGTSVWKKSTDIGVSNKLVN